MAQLKEYISAITWLESVHLDGAVLYFNYFSQCYSVVTV